MGNSKVNHSFNYFCKLQILKVVILEKLYEPELFLGEGRR